MFDTLSDKLQGIFRSLRGQGTLTEAHVDAALREIRLALLEADVHFKVVKQFLERVRARAVGQDVLKSLTPDQAVLRIVRDEMVDAARRRRAAAPRSTASRLPSVVLMTGLQGSGKTTTTRQARPLAGSRRPPSPARLHRRATGPPRASSSARCGTQAGLKVHHPEGPRTPQALLRSRPRRGARRRATTSCSWTPPAACTSTTS